MSVVYLFHPTKPRTQGKIKEKPFKFFIDLKKCISRNRKNASKQNSIVFCVARFDVCRTPQKKNKNQIKSTKSQKRQSTKQWEGGRSRRGASLAPVSQAVNQPVACWLAWSVPSVQFKFLLFFRIIKKI